MVAAADREQQLRRREVDRRTRRSKTRTFSRRERRVAETVRCPGGGSTCAVVKRVTSAGPKPNILELNNQ